MKNGGGRYRKVDVSWRKAEPIDVLLNPWGPEGVRMVEALTEICDSRGRTSTAVSFTVNASGLLWFSSAMVGMHGDEARGVLLPDERDDAMFDLKPDKVGAPAVLWGTVFFKPLDVRNVSCAVPLDTVFGPVKFLNSMTAWRKLWATTSLAEPAWRKEVA